MTLAARPTCTPTIDPADFTRRDVGVVVLDAPVRARTYGALPTLNQLDALAAPGAGSRTLTFTAVGYGVQRSVPGRSDVEDREPAAAHGRDPAGCVQVNTGFTGDYSMLLSTNANTGGTCFGDSGGPELRRRQQRRRWGDLVRHELDLCSGTGGVFRMDRSWALDWVGTFLDAS